jgi:hypothetical protein
MLLLPACASSRFPAPLPAVPPGLFTSSQSIRSPPASGTCLIRPVHGVLSLFCRVIQSDSAFFSNNTYFDFDPAGFVASAPMSRHSDYRIQQDKF